MDRERLRVDMGLKGIEPIGRGDEKEVFEHRDPKKVVKITDNDEAGKFEAGNERYIKAEFYLTKILHLLFPENIPNIHQVSFANQASVHEKKELDHDHKVVADYYLHDYPNHVEPDENVRKSLSVLQERKARAPLIRRLQSLGINIDRSRQNFAEDKNGYTVFLDSILPWVPAHMYARPLPFKTHFNIDQLRLIIVENLQDAEQEQALNFLERLAVLAIEEEDRHNTPNT